jgi:hypothetical protein
MLPETKTATAAALILRRDELEIQGGHAVLGGGTMYS